jgi:hypothetical protein
MKPCGELSEISADRSGDDLGLLDIEPGFVCAACGKRGADVRPKFSQGRMGTDHNGDVHEKP